MSISSMRPIGPHSTLGVTPMVAKLAANAVIATVFLRGIPKAHACDAYTRCMDDCKWASDAALARGNSESECQRIAQTLIDCFRNCLQFEPSRYK